MIKTSPNSVGAIDCCEVTLCVFTDEEESNQKTPLEFSLFIAVSLQYDFVCQVFLNLTELSGPEEGAIKNKNCKLHT